MKYSPLFSNLTYAIKAVMLMAITTGQTAVYADEQTSLLPTIQITAQ